MTEHVKTCWIVTEGLAGTENPCIGLAEALGMTPEIKRIRLRMPWRVLSPWITPATGHALAPGSASLSPPWPDLLITSGRKSIGVGLEVKRRSRGRTFHVHVQDPRLYRDKFDLIVAPQHDGLSGPNVIGTVAGLHKITPAALNQARLKWQGVFAALPSPRVAVLIGGSSKKQVMTPDITRRLCDQLMSLKAGLMVTASRRTGAENTRMLKERLQGPHVYFWDGQGDNPYAGFLALADYIIVTEDSVSMTSEALATGKPVFIVPLAGQSRRLQLFHALLQQQGYTRPFAGRLESWTYAPPDDTSRAAREILNRMDSKG